MNLSSEESFESSSLLCSSKSKLYVGSHTCIHHLMYYLRSFGSSLEALICNIIYCLLYTIELGMYKCKTRRQRHHSNIWVDFQGLV
jgi:hypothetical protein